MIHRLDDMKNIYAFTKCGHTFVLIWDDAAASQHGVYGQVVRWVEEPALPVTMRDAREVNKAIVKRTDRERLIDLLR